jgi:hypothetical protein
MKEYLYECVYVLCKKRNAKGVASGFTKPNKRRATLHKQNQEWRGREMKKQRRKAEAKQRNKMQRFDRQCDKTGNFILSPRAN